jgi:citrate synthase
MLCADQAVSCAAVLLCRCIMLCADHGPCVSGAHNTIVTSRAGKDLVSCLVSGLLTIGPRFGGAIDDAARCGSEQAQLQPTLLQPAFMIH